MRKLFAFIIGTAALSVQAAEPENYYQSCEGKTGKELLQSLRSVVGPHRNVGYDGLWNVYKTSDVRADGTLWDIYSTKAWPSNFTKCGNYKKVGDCVNKEHSFPKSWFGGKANPMYADAYHLYPTDGKVNGQRSNLPYGECANGTSESPNGNVRALGKKGTSTFPGYSGTVFEPDNEYKGDLARTYFYMAAAYNDKIAGWSSNTPAKEMLAGNNYPAYKTWAVNLLLKWHRQDPVSKKEQDRNEAVSRHQNNRNPFIDHPELVEYIWGNKQGMAWYVGAGNEPQIISPADGSGIDLGLSSIGITRSRRITVKGADLKENVRVNVTGTGFTVTPSSLPLTTVCTAAGAEITVSYMSEAASSATGSLILRSGDVTTTVSLHCTAVDGLPAGPATDISDESFTARWSCIDDPASTYTLDVMRDGRSLPGYPTKVTAGDEHAAVNGLQPETAYTYTVASPTLTSQPVSVTTAAPIPSVEFLYDGHLEFVTTPGQPSEIAEILTVIENIPGDVTISVSSPFQVSTDKQSWGNTVTLSPGEERFYMRLFGQTEGSYSTSVVAMAEGYNNDDLDVDGTIGQPAPSFHEDFEPKGEGTYSKKTYLGSACKWETDAYFGTGADNYPHEGNQAVRMNKSTPGYLTMLEAKPNGMGTLTLWAHLWKTDTKTVTLTASVSADQGSTWENVGKIVIEPNGNGGNNRYQEYTLPINRTGSLRLKLQQDIVSRTMIDDIRLTDCRSSGIEEANAAEYHTWDAYCRNGRLILESDGSDDNFATVYSVDGTERHAAILPPGETALDLPAGLYIVVVRDFSRRVLVK